jgi:hypothetical protein
MKIVFSVTIILLFGLANQAAGVPGVMCPLCATTTWYPKNCKYGYGTRINRKTKSRCSCVPDFVRCADRPKVLPPNTFPSRDYVDLSSTCKKKISKNEILCSSCTWGKIYRNENDCCGSCLEPTKDALYDYNQGFDEQSDGFRGTDTASLHDNNVNVPLYHAKAVLGLNIKVGTSVTGIPLSKFNRFMKTMFYVDRSHTIHVGFDAESRMHVGLGAATVRDWCNDKMQIVVVAKRSSNLQKLKAVLTKDLKSKMNPSKRCSRRIRGVGGWNGCKSEECFRRPSFRGNQGQRYDEDEDERVGGWRDIDVAGKHFLIRHGSTIRRGIDDIIRVKPFLDEDEDE